MTLIFFTLAHRYLSNNHMSGTIPSSLGSLTALLWLCVPLALSDPLDWTLTFPLPAQTAIRQRPLRR